MLESGVAEYQSGSVETHIRRGISTQGALEYTSSSTDVAVRGKGFFVVSSSDDHQFLTRAGSFVKDGTGDLINAAGYALMGYPLSGGSAVPVANGTAGLQRVNIATLGLSASPSSSGTLAVNLPAGAGVVAAGNQPSDNVASSTYGAKTSMVAYGNLGGEAMLDVYYAKTAANTWQVTVFDRAAAGTSGFPYSSGPLATSVLSFDSTSGALTSTPSLSLTVPNGQTLELDLTGTTQLDTGFLVEQASVDGNAAGAVDRVELDGDGKVYAIYANGSRLAVFQVPLADVASPDNLRVISGNVFEVSADSGSILMGLADADGRGTLVSGALEQSTVDIATELTSMIETQRVYTANSKVFQTGAEMTDVLVNLVR